MLELRPICEHCATDLPPASSAAMICSYECTFCSTCVEELLGNVCPNCGGGFTHRPVRPRGEWRDGVTLANFPASAERKHRPVDPSTHSELRGRLRNTAPDER